MIKAENLVKKFDDYTALNGISCEIPDGCIYGMVGSNGAGKSTLLRMITGVYRPEGGTVTLDGERIYNNPDTKLKIAYVPDELYFIANANMERMALLYKSTYPTFDDSRFQYLTKSFELDVKKNIGTFSKGMKRQAATILALSVRPKYLFLDETFDGLDPIMRHVVRAIICEDVIESGTTAVITSHSLRELEDTCDQLALLHKGGLVFESDIQDLKTTLFKVQIAFIEEYDKSLFEDIKMINFSKRGSVSNLIVRGDRQTVIEQLRQKCPILMDVLPLSLEEVFTYEMEARGYSFNNVLEGIDDEE